MDYGIGPGSPAGFLWMKSSDLNWYQISLSGSNPSASLYINQNPLTYGSSSNAGLYQDNSLGYQLLQGSDGNVYPIFLSGNSGSVTLKVSQSIWSNPYDYKPYLLMKSITDSKFYIVAVLVASGTSSLYISQSSATTLNLYN